MPEYLSPGVYVEEVDAGPKPIQGVGTSTTGAVGVTVRGPTSGKPELVTSFPDYQRKFGGYLPVPNDTAIVNRWEGDDAEGGRWWAFPLAVKGFFDNGGQRLYVKRVYSSTAVASRALCRRGLVSEIVRDVAVDTSGTATDTTISLRHLFGLGPASTLTLVGGDGTAIDGGATFTVQSYNATTNQVTVTPAVQTALGADQAFAEIHPRTPDAAVADSALADAETTLRFSARALGAWGDDLSVRVRPVLGATLTVVPPAGAGPLQSTTLAETATPGDQITVVGADGFEEDAAPSFSIRMGGREYGVTDVAAPDVDGNVAVTLAPIGGQDPITADVPAGTTVTRLRPAVLTNPGGDPRVVNLTGASRLYPGAIVELDTGTAKQTTSVVGVDGSAVEFDADLGGYLDGHRARLIEAEVAVRYQPEGGDPVVEVFGPLRLTDDDPASSLVHHVNDRSELVEVETGGGFSESVLANFPVAADGHWALAFGGDDGYGGLTVDDFMGVQADGERRGVDALELIDEVAICVAPGMWSQTVRNSLTQHCELLKDRFAIVDPTYGLDIEGVREFRAPIDTRYAALYYPWLRLRDPSQGREVVAPPSGHLAGIYARVDVERGVHKAPANVVVRGITGFEKDVTRQEQDLLNPQGINALRFFPGRGNRVWGARTLSSDGSWKYINVRRLFIFVEESIDEGTQWVVFEPNAEDLWARVRASVSNFLTTVWRSGALEGTTADQAFFVVCDRTTMTQDDIDNGRLICLIGIAPVKPAEFVIFRIQQKTLEVVA